MNDLLSHLDRISDCQGSTDRGLEGQLTGVESVKDTTQKTFLVFLKTTQDQKLRILSSTRLTNTVILHIGTVISLVAVNYFREN